MGFFNPYRCYNRSVASWQIDRKRTRFDQELTSKQSELDNANLELTKSKEEIGKLQDEIDQSRRKVETPKEGTEALLERTDQLLQAERELHKQETVGLRTDNFKLKHAEINGGHIDEDLISLLESGRTMSERDILEALKISPKDEGAARALHKQLIILKEADIVKELVGDGWKWIESESS